MTILWSFTHIEGYEIHTLRVGMSTVSARLVLTDYILDEAYTLAKAYFRKHKDHGYSFTDCTSFVVMRELRLREALTADQHFVEAGFRGLWWWPDPGVK